MSRVSCVCGSESVVGQRLAEPEEEEGDLRSREAYVAEVCGSACDSLLVETTQECFLVFPEASLIYLESFSFPWHHCCRSVLVCNWWFSPQRLVFAS